MNRPPFSQKMSASDFQKYYWYKQELQDICHKYHLPTTGTKAELNQYIIAFLNGQNPTTIKPTRRNNNNFMLTAQQITPDTKLLASGFRFNQEARKFFANYFHLPKFTFKKAMAAKLRAIQQNNDEQATVQDLIEVYLHPQIDHNHPSAEETTYQWNQFVKDFCADPKTQNYQPKLTIAALLWRHVRDSNQPKKYSSKLLDRYQQEINSLINTL